MDQVLAGRSACVFAYGPASSGKTYSLVGPNPTDAASPSVDPEAGLVPRALDLLLKGAATTNRRAETSTVRTRVFMR